jgi:hypothetical protein
VDTGTRIGEACTITLDTLKLDRRHIIVGAEGKGRREWNAQPGVTRLNPFQGAVHD